MNLDLDRIVTFKSFPYDDDENLLEFTGIIINTSLDEERVFVSYEYKGIACGDWIPVSIIKYK